MDVILVKIIKEKAPSSAIELIKLVTEYDPNNVMSIIEKIAAGADGISGTEDDIVSLEVLETVRVLLDHKVVNELVKEFSIAVNSKGCSCFN